MVFKAELSLTNQPVGTTPSSRHSGEAYLRTVKRRRGSWDVDVLFDVLPILGILKGAADREMILNLARPLERPL